MIFKSACLAAVVAFGLAAQTPSLTDAVTTARTALAAAVFAEPRNDAAIRAKVDALRDAEVALANARPATDQPVPSAGVGGGRGGRGGIPNITQRQAAALAQMNTDLTALVQAATAARTGLAGAAPAAIKEKAEALRAAELALAIARADWFAKMQATSSKLAADQVAALIAAGGSVGGGRGGGMGFTQPEPLDFNDHEGYISLFDGVSLKGWDGNPKFWRVEGGAIVGESTPQNPSGNSYIVYRDVEAKDFTLKFEIKIEGTGGSGIQYRSKTGLPWLANIAPNVTANVGPVNLNWMMTGPQADFWPNSRDWTGQFYSENTPMRILSWRGQVVEGAGLGTKRLMGTIGDRQALGTLVKMNDWNQFTVIARGGTFIHILNGQLMAVMVDDDPNSSNNQSGLFGIEIEATTKVFVRNMWLKKLN
jgi:hypothetical protein